MKTGEKMKTETEFGFEPSLLVKMVAVQADPESDRAGTIQKRRAMVIGDRFGIIDGHSFDNPTFDSFRPHVELLVPGSTPKVDTGSRSRFGVDETGDADWQREKKARAILCEEIQAALTDKFPTRGAKDNKAKLSILKHVFQTGSWTKVESMDSKTLSEGKARLEAVLSVEGNVDRLIEGEPVEEPEVAAA